MVEKGQSESLFGFKILLSFLYATQDFHSPEQSQTFHCLFVAHFHQSGESSEEESKD